MKRPFDPEVIHSQIASLKGERDRIDAAISALESALRSMDRIGEVQRELVVAPRDSDVSLLDAVKAACVGLEDGITRQRVIHEIERINPFLKPNPSSVSAAMNSLAKGDNPMLHLAEAGSGRRPSVYSTQGELLLQLSGEEIEELLDPNATKGTGGWQSLWASLLKNFNKTEGSILTTPTLRARLQHYYRSYGSGGWQNKAKRVLRRHHPHLFT